MRTAATPAPCPVPTQDRSRATPPPGAGPAPASLAAPTDPDLPTPGPHTLSQAGAEFITQDNNEKYQPKPYGDPRHCSIGYGHLISLRSCADPAIKAQVAAIA